MKTEAAHPMKGQETVDIKVRCCVCSRERTALGWSFARHSPGALYSHTYCPACYADERTKLDLEVARGSILRLTAVLLCLFAVRAFGQAGNQGEVLRVERYSCDYPVVDTGQNTCYNNGPAISAPSPGEPFYGQDAQYDGYQPSYTVSDDGLTVLDNITGLTWTQTPDTNSDGEIDLADKYNWSEAMSYPATLNAAGYGGYSDWRLPTIKELYSLMDFRGRDPMVHGADTSGLIPFIDTTYFDFGYGDTAVGERIIDAQFASQTLYVTNVMGRDIGMFGLNLADGRIKGYPTTKDFYVFYVRGNQEYGVNDFVDNGDGTVTDHATGLMWQQADSRTGLLWQEALAYAEDLELAGYRDWRLPNAKELQSIVDYTRAPDTSSSAAIDPVFLCTTITNEYPAVDYPWYWSSTTHARHDGSGSSGVYVCFGRGTGYMFGEWLDVHGAGCQRSDRKDGNFTGYTYVYDGYYFGSAPQGDAARMYNHVRCVRGGVKQSASDSDGDGLSDAYEYNYAGSITGMLAAADNDGDGASNADEETAGTVPTDGDSLLAIVRMSASDTGVVVCWSSELGKTYSLLCSTNLQADPCQKPVASEVRATTPLNVHTNIPTGPVVFYRVVVH